MTSNDIIKESILSRSRELFLARGFSSVTTDNIAASIGISKKTIYRHFRSKEDLLEAAVLDMINKVGQRISKNTCDDSLAFPEKINNLLLILSGALNSFKPEFINDIKLHARTLWTKIDNIRKEKISNNIMLIIEQGKASGHVRRDLDEGILMVLFMNLIQGTINPDALSGSKYAPTELLNGIFLLVFFGALTEKGRKCLSGVSGRSLQSSGGKK